MPKENKQITVMIVDDHPLLREGVGAVLAREHDIVLVAEAANVHAGRLCIPDEIARTIVEHSVDDQLTQREVEVLRQVAAGNANKEIAAQLSITEETVKTHVGHILSKLAARDRTHAVIIGIKRGIIDS